MMDGVVVTKFRNAWRTCLHHEVTMVAWSYRVPAVHKDEPCMNKHQARGAKVRWNVRRDCGVESKPRLSGVPLSAWTGRPGVSWMETVVAQSGQYRSGGSQHVLS